MPPFLREAETLDPSMQKCPALLADSGIADESSITDNASTDSSIDIAQRSGARLVPARPGASFRKHLRTTPHAHDPLAGTRACTPVSGCVPLALLFRIPLPRIPCHHCRLESGQQNRVYRSSPSQGCRFVMKRGRECMLSGQSPRDSHGLVERVQTVERIALPCDIHHDQRTEQERDHKASGQRSKTRPPVPPPSLDRT